MFITRLSLRDFRNYARADVELGPGLNVVCGPNGAGKTNLLEALYFSLTARSCRTSNEREVVRLGGPVTGGAAEGSRSRALSPTSARTRGRTRSRSASLRARRSACASTAPRSSVALL